MEREEIYKEMEETFGFVPSFFKLVPVSSLQHEWELFKATDLSETAIPKKYKELLGVGVSAAIRCRYCSLFHTEMARLHGATEAEIGEAAHLAKCTTGWSTFLNGMQVDYDEFKNELKRASAYVKEKFLEKAA